MQPSLLLLIIAGYFSVLMMVSWWTSRQRSDRTYFDGDKKSPWFLVAFGMIGSGISAVSLVSIPGNVGNDHLYYFQFILGSIIGYLFIAFVLVPTFYRHQVVSLYSYLGDRFGSVTYKTGSLFFIVSQSFGAALRLLLSVKILQDAFLNQLGIPYPVSIVLILGLIWLYTHQSGVKTIVWTDTLQSLSLLLVLILSIRVIIHSLGYDWQQLTNVIRVHPLFDWFNFSPRAGSNFFKQFISGFLITVALVGLDQSMMQKTLTIRDQRAARSNVLTFSFFIAMAQTLFLILGILLYLFAEQKGIPLALQNGQYVDTDTLYPYLTMNYFGKIGVVAFFIGVIASTFASIDSCIAALTTSISYDFFRYVERSHEDRVRIKRWVLLGVNAIMFAIIMIFWNNQGAIINTIFRIAGYTYGPLLGLFLAGLFTRLELRQRWVPIVCLVAALLTYLLNIVSSHYFHFNFGFMNIAVNAALTLLFLVLIRKSNAHGRSHRTNV